MGNSFVHDKSRKQFKCSTKTSIDTIQGVYRGIQQMQFYPL